jgi:hypothetical protein
MGKIYTLEDLFSEPYQQEPVVGENTVNSQGYNSIDAESINTSITFYSVQENDNFDSSHNLIVKFSIPLDAVQIVQVLLDVYSFEYRGYNVGNASESAHTHDFDHTHDATHSHFFLMDSHFHTEDLGSHSHTVSGGITSTYTYPGGNTGSTGPITGSGGTIDLATSLPTPDVTAAGAPHTHGVTYGIFEDTYANNMGIIIDNVNRTSVLGGSWNPSVVTADRTIQGLNITPYIFNNNVNNGAHQLELTTSQNGRAIVQVYIKCVLKR